LTRSPVKPRLSLVALVLVPMAFARRQLAGRCGGFPERACPGCGPGGGQPRRAGGKRRRRSPSAPDDQLPRQRLPALGAPPCPACCPRYPWHFRVLTSQRWRPPCGRWRAKPAL